MESLTIVWYNITMKLKKILILFTLCAVSAGVWAVTPGPGSLYATDAYPGFDSDSNILQQKRKEQSIFFWRKAKFEKPEEQLVYARSLAAQESYGDAVTAYNALVARWPLSSEAAVAQEELADVHLYKIDDPIVAFEEYKYLIDFYSSNCNYDKVMSKMYETVKMMRERGKKVVFFKFANTTDVRRAFEAVVRRAPGAMFAPEAMYAIVELREKDEEYSEAISVCRTIRNRYPSTAQAKAALYKEAEMRMVLLKAHDYNRDRSLNTVSFMDMAAATTDDADARADFLKWRGEAYAVVEREAYEAARFYDSITRKRRGAINAYESFLRDYPASSYAQQVRDRLTELKPVSVGRESK